jgi:hypothetical protein
MQKEFQPRLSSPPWLRRRRRRNRLTHAHCPIQGKNKSHVELVQSHPRIIPRGLRDLAGCWRSKQVVPSGHVPPICRDGQWGGNQRHGSRTSPLPPRAIDRRPWADARLGRCVTGSASDGIPSAAPGRAGDPSSGVRRARGHVSRSLSHTGEGEKGEVRQKRKGEVSASTPPQPPFPAPKHNSPPRSRAEAHGSLSPRPDSSTLRAARPPAGETSQKREASRPAWHGMVGTRRDVTCG